MASSPQWVLSADGRTCAAVNFPAPGDRQYASQSMCDYARYRSDPQTFSHPQTLQCNPLGCQNVWQQPASTMMRANMRMHSGDHHNGPEWRAMGAGWGGGKVAYTGGWKQFW